MTERLLGAAVLIVAAVLIIPALLDGPEPDVTVSRELALPAPDGAASTAEPVRTHTVEIDTGTPGEGDLAAETENIEPAPPAPVPPVREEARTTPASPTPAAPPPGGWAVQVGSFTSETNARRLVEHLKGSGYPAFVTRNVVNGRVMFRVRVGPEPDRERAAALAERLQADRQQTQLVNHP